LTPNITPVEELERLLQAASLDNERNTGRTPSLANENLQRAPLSPFQGLDIFGTDSLPPQQDLSFLLSPLADTEISNLPQASSHELIDLGLLEQLPSFDLIDKL